jgi:hypothetical protein
MVDSLSLAIEADLAIYLGHQYCTQFNRQIYNY